MQLSALFSTFFFSFSEPSPKSLYKYLKSSNLNTEFYSNLVVNPVHGKRVSFIVLVFVPPILHSIRQTST